MPIYKFPGENKKPQSSTINSKQDTTGSLVEKILNLAKKYDPENDPAIKAFKRRIRSIEK